MERDSAGAAPLMKLIQDSGAEFNFGSPPVIAMVISVLSVIAFPLMILAVIYFLLIRPAQMGGNQA